MNDNFNGVRHTIIVIYCLVAAYSIWNVLVGFVTVFVAYGPVYGGIFPIALFLVATSAVIGVYRTERVEKKLVEIVATLFFMGFLLTFALAILIRNLFEGHDDQLQGALLPIIIGVPSYFRLVEIFPPIRKQPTQ